MLQAQLRGKLTRAEENMKDLLTSNVFGSIKYVPYEDGLLPLLANCQDENGDTSPKAGSSSPTPGTTVLNKSNVGSQQMIVLLKLRFKALGAHY
jgi:hypothetical protein